jgi:DNA-binding MarR family transcriptional regulator
MAEDEMKKEKLLSNIDKIIHEPARFLIMANLYVVESADFLFLLNQTGLTQGNLSSHIGKLEAAGYIDVKKEFLNKRPHTLLSITSKGISVFQQYKRYIKQLLDDIPER